MPSLHCQGGLKFVLGISVLFCCQTPGSFAFVVRPYSPVLHPTLATSRVAKESRTFHVPHHDDISNNHGRSFASTKTRLFGTAAMPLPQPMRSVISPLLSLAVLGTVILVHECGHYFAARAFQIEVLEFNIGMGPRLLGFQALGSQFSLRAIPIGGYVLFAGEHEDDDNEKEADDQNKKTANTTDPSKWLNNRPWWERAVVLSGGVVFNLLFSYCLYLGILIKIGLLQYASLPKLAQSTAKFMGRMIRDQAVGIGSILGGVVASAVSAIGNFWLRILRKLVSLFYFFWAAAPSSIAAQTLSQVPSSVAATAKPLSKLSGPVKILQVGSDVAYHHGFSTSLLEFASHISLNLGVANAFPLPILDGGRLLFVLIEAMTGRKVDPRVEQTANSLTSLLLLWLFFSTSWNDLRFLLAR